MRVRAQVYPVDLYASQHFSRLGGTPVPDLSAGQVCETLLVCQARPACLCAKRQRQLVWLLDMPLHTGSQSLIMPNRWHM